MCELWCVGALRLWVHVLRSAGKEKKKNGIYRRDAGESKKSKLNTGKTLDYVWFFACLHNNKLNQTCYVESGGEKRLLFDDYLKNECQILDTSPLV